jgi:outer membrane protein assembly factor BamB
MCNINSVSIGKLNKKRFLLVYFVIQITFFVSTIYSCKITREGLIRAGREEKREAKCDGKDNNKNDLIDEGCLLWYYEFPSIDDISPPKICSNKTIVLGGAQVLDWLPIFPKIYGLRLDDGRIIWESNIPDAKRIINESLLLEVYDLDGDQKEEIIISYTLKALHILDCEGKFLLIYRGKQDNKIEIDKRESFFGPASVDDIDQDGKGDIVVNETIINIEEIETSKSELYILNWNKNVNENYSISLTDFFIYPYYFKPLIGDIDGDGKKEIILFGRFKRKVTDETFSYKPLKGETLKNLKDKFFVIGNGIIGIDITDIIDIFTSTPPPTLGDINSDRKEEIIIPSGTNLYAIDEKGNLLWDFNIGYHIASQPVISDIDSDGKPEILFISRDGKIKVLNGEGKLISEYEVWKRDEIVEVGASSLALVDIDFDGRKEIIGWTDEVFMIRNGVKVWNFIVGGPKRDFEPPLVVNDDGDFKIVVTFANRIYTLKAGKVKK